ncbi:hypothetical protein GDO78_002777 [Eleutherodactylus coqui]|uniref:Uncharacterized protein n=1 Tax=Eleutherodactylus coqui TaxID=57060 RepID=A0A8J6EZL8_ELECQ|nr:hypothetical protein GDO78_002777 [Eleutherodactylus coqui]
MAKLAALAQSGSSPLLYGAPCSSAPSRADSSQSGGWNRQWTAQKSCGPRRKRPSSAVSREVTGARGFR